jgi:cytochrome c-type biogenesis protein CcmH
VKVNIKTLLISCLLALYNLFIVSLVYAVEPHEVLKNPDLEKRAREISLQLRCVVCDNQTIDDSNADIAKDLRLLVREQLQQGKTDEEIMAFLTERYGDYVLLKPTVSSDTYILWFGPFIIIMTIFIILVLKKQIITNKK